MIVVEVGVTLLLVALAVFAIWLGFPRRTPQDDSSRNEGGNTHVSDSDNSGDGGAD
jgi:hypothetical protein